MSSELSAIGRIVATQQTNQSAETDAKVDPERAEKLREAAQKFEEMMLRQLFTQMQRSASSDGEGGMAKEFYGDMFAEKMAEQAAGTGGGIGVADVLMRAWGVESPRITTLENDPLDPAGDDF